MSQQLPHSSSAKQWPWEWAVVSVPEKMENGSEWPRISIVTPSYNQGEFIEETIRSVLLQGYPNLEYIVIDGGSTDSSIDIIKKYSPWITYWVSEKDRGQSHAINKGFDHATGEIFSWLNSDDYFLPGALEAFAQAYRSHRKSVVWAGIAVEIDKAGNETGQIQPSIEGDVNFISDWWISSKISQPACAFSGADFNKIKGLNEELHYAMDLDLWIKLRKRGKFSQIDKKVACARFYSENKTAGNTEMSDAEIIHICFTHGQRQAAENRIRLVGDRYKKQCEWKIKNLINGQGLSYFDLSWIFFKRTLLAPVRLIKNNKI